jgi:hypothetical protein
MPTAAAKLGFYEGYLSGGGAPTTAVAVFTLTGLPAHTGMSSLAAARSCYELDLSFASLVCFANGPIGYSWKFLGADVNGTLGATGPMLAMVNDFGMVDSLDSSCGGPFSLGGNLTSMSLAIREAKPITAVTGTWTGDGQNEDLLSQSLGGAVIGSPWATAITSVNAHGASGPMSLTIRTGTVNGPNFPSPLGGRINEVLIGGPFLLSQTASHGAGPGPFSFPAVAIPKRLSVICVPYAAQGTIVGGGFADLTTAVTGVTGTQ